VTSALPHAAGQVQAGFAGATPWLAGWVLEPDGGPFDAVRVLVDGVPAGEAEPQPVPGVAAAVPWVRGAARSGFRFESEALAAARRVELIGVRAGADAARYPSLMRSQADRELPLPPPELAVPSSGFARKGGSGDDGTGRWERGFVAGGLSAAGGLIEQIERHAGEAGGLRILDWGCGCGRVTRHMLGRGYASVRGCDIDPDAVAWCDSNLAGAEFIPSDPDPPLPLADGEVDVVFGCSVMTHLDAEQQDRWLTELRRVAAPGGLVLLSTQGEYAYLRAALSRARALGRLPGLPQLAAGILSRRLARDGLVDRGATAALDGVAPEGYYRAIAQSREHTVRAFGEHFEILDFIERGLDGHQDLAVMQRPA
jgi:SAM-dependent methyltransferase